MHVDEKIRMAQLGIQKGRMCIYVESFHYRQVYPNNMFLSIVY